MIRILGRSSENVIGIECDGTVTVEKFEEVLPAIDRAVDLHGQINMLFLIKTIRGYGLKEFAADIKFAVTHWKSIRKVAIVSDREWWKPATMLENLLTSWEERYFDLSELEEAWRWLEEDLPEQKTT
ncbi:SpoIIAA family protein [Salidesulfovibrio brasiliensis]